MNQQISYQSGTEDLNKSGRLIGGIMIASWVCKFFLWFVTFYAGGDVWSGYSIADYLINWESGFVRRGAYGEFLYQYSSLTGLSPLTILVPIFAGAYIAVTVWLLRLCSNRGVKWWIVLSAVLCGFVDYIERKDYVLYLLVFWVFTLLKGSGREEGHDRISVFKTVGIGLILTAGLFIHEAFFFWGCPVMIFLLWPDSKRRNMTMAIAVWLTGIFLTMCFFKGDTANAVAIHDSWAGLIPLPEDWRDCGALEALSWKLGETVRYHFMSNLHTEPYNWLTAIWRLAAFTVFYILMTNYFFFFSRSRKHDFLAKGNEYKGFENDASGESCSQGCEFYVRRNVLSGWFLLIMLFMLPYWLFLSNDWGRLYQALAVTIAGLWLILPYEKLKDSLPQIFYSAASGINRRLYRILIPTRGLLLLMLLFLGISPYNFQPVAAFCQSPIGSILSTLLDLAYNLKSLIL